MWTQLESTSPAGKCTFRNTNQTNITRRNTKIEKLNISLYEAQLNIYQHNSSEEIQNLTVGDMTTVKISFKDDKQLGVISIE